MNYYGFVTFFLVNWLLTYYCIFSRARAQLEPVDRFSRFMARDDVFSPKDGPFGGRDNIGIHLEVISPQKNPPKGA